MNSTKVRAKKELVLVNTSTSVNVVGGLWVCELRRRLVPGTCFFYSPQTTPKLQNPQFFTFWMGHHRNNGRRGSFSPSAGYHFHPSPKLVMASVGRAGWCRMAVTRSRVTWQTCSLFQFVPDFQRHIELRAPWPTHQLPQMRLGTNQVGSIIQSQSYSNLWGLLDRFSRFVAFLSVPLVCWAHLKLCVPTDSHSSAL
jgi:hypothetical protein